MEARQLFAVTYTNPVIGANTYNVSATLGNGTTDATASIQAALDSAHTAGGGTVNIPAGTFLSGPLSIYSHTNLNLASGATLELQPLGSSYFPVSATTDYADFIGATSQTDIEVSGAGHIEGQGKDWIAASDAGTITDRPSLIRFFTSKNVLITGISMLHSPSAHISIKNGVTNMTVDGITINSPDESTGQPYHNTDGIDISGTNILIENNNISCGDDHIAIGGSVAPTNGVAILNNTFEFGHGMSIGSITRGGGQGIQNVLIDGLTITGTPTALVKGGLRIKSDNDRGAIVQNITYQNVTMNYVNAPISMTMYYNGLGTPTTPEAVTATEPKFKNITYNNITATNSGTASGLIGRPESTIDNITFNNVNISQNGTTQFVVDNVQNLVWTGTSSFKNGNTVIGFSNLNSRVVKTGFTSQDIGTPTTAGTSTYNPGNNTWSLAGVGTDITAASDQFELVNSSFVGDGTVIADVTSQSSATAGAKAGVMLRSTNAVDSAFAAVVATPSTGIQFLWRTDNGTTVQVASSVRTIKAPIWVKLVRSSNTITAFYSTTGAANSYTQIGTAQSVKISSTALAGLAVSSASATVANTVGFSNVSIAQTLPAAPTVSSVVINDGSAQRSMINSITVNFSTPVTLASGAISLVQFGTTTAVPFTLTPNGTGLATQYVLTFPNGVGGSIANGKYTLSVNGSLVTDTYGQHASADATNNFFRLFGDANGDGFADGLDGLSFRKANNSSSSDSNYVSYFDSNGDGFIDAIDGLQLRKDATVSYSF